MTTNKGLVYVFEGNGKGKTSAALGVTVRSLLLGKKVEWISWFKEKSYPTAEMGLSKVFKRNLKMHWMGKGFYGGSVDHDTPYGHLMAAKKALKLAKSLLITKKDSGNTPDLLVLDEVLRAVNDGLLSTQDLIDVVNTRSKTHIILTGHVCPTKIVDMADLVTRMEKIKHPFDKKVLAVPGLDF